MRNSRFFVVLVLLCLVAWARPIFVHSQPLTDSTVNYYTLSAYYDHYYDSLIEQRGRENMQGTGFKDYLRWKWFYGPRHGVDGDLEAVWDASYQYHHNFQPPAGYTDESDWTFSGPIGIPLRHGENTSPHTGKGMIISLWVDDDDHSLIYAGSHHGGLWKTTDVEGQWVPLHDHDPRIHGVNSIAVDPTNHKTIYITGNNSLAEVSSYSAGLFKSTDGGLNWDSIHVAGESYPSANWGRQVRKIVLDKNKPSNLYFVNYRNVYKSEDQGSTWHNIFNKNYYPWDNTDPSFLDYHNGLFDFKLAPWTDTVAYLAGSEVFELVESQGNYDTLNLSDEVFFIGLNPGDSMIRHPHRTAISLNARFPEQVWFCYAADYYRNDTNLTWLRIVKYTPPDHFDLLYDALNSSFGASGDKLVFSVSPSYDSVFYIGGTYLFKLDLRDSNAQLIDIVDGEYPDACWMHIDMRDMMIFGDKFGHDTLYLANDGGVSWGTDYSPGPECGNDSWHWRHPCASLTDGLNVTEFYGLGLSESRPDLLAGGCQDLNDMLLDSNQWINFGVGDGGSDVIFDPIFPDTIYFYEWQTGSIYRSPDLGETKDRIFIGAGSYVFTPLILDPVDNSVLYSGNTNLLKLSDVNNFSQPDPPVDTLASFNHSISEIEVVKSPQNSKIFYVGTLKWYESNDPPSSYTGCIYRSEDGINFTDISAGLNGCYYGHVADIEVNPFNPYKIWVACAKYSEGYQDSKVFAFDSTGNSWQDISQGLPEGLPVFKIKYIPQLGRLLAGCDVGVFKRDAWDTIWYPYVNNLPFKIVTDMALNRPFRKLVASTYGRGIWQTELTEMEDICEITEPPLHIDTLVTWTKETLLKGDIVIDDGGVLEIVNCGVFMPENARITIGIGGKLVIDGATITSACPSLWAGIAVWGSENCQYYEELFGVVELKNHAVIENAQVAISNYCTDCENIFHPGGIIRAYDATFRNNEIAVNFAPFANMFQGKEWPCKASFTRCAFEFNRDKLDSTQFLYFIKMNRVNGVRFVGCDFINSNALSGSEEEIKAKYGSGIFTLGSQFYVDQACLDPDIQPCQAYKPCTFYGLNYGIYTMGIDPIYTVTAKHSIFRDNVTGIFLSGIENATVILNEFHVNQKYTEPPVPYEVYVGLYLDFCTGFTVEENLFNQEGVKDFHNAGIIVKDAGENNNEIYKNYFKNRFEVGIMALNKNRGGTPDKGLLIKCNEFEYQEFIIYDILVMEEDTVTENSGIAKNQGSNIDERSPAGNLFTHRMHSADSDYSNQINRNRIIYYMHDTTSSTIRVKPKHYTQNSITLISTGYQFNDTIACRSNLMEPDTLPHVHKAKMELENLKSDSVQTILNAWVDGGNTEEMISEVVYSMPPEAYELYSDLINTSPYLSDTVLIESIQKEEVLDNVMIEDILVSNPHAAKSASIQETLDNKYYPLTEDQRENIDQGNDIVSFKEILESNLAWYTHSKAMICDDILTLYKNDTVDENKKDSLIDFINDVYTMALLYQLAFIRSNEGDSAEAINTLNNIENSFDLDNAQQIVHQQYHEYLDQYAKILDSDDPIVVLDSASKSTLYILSGQKSFPGVYASNILQFFDTLVYIEPYLLPSGQVKAGEISADNNKEPIIKNEYFRIYPNPAISYFVAEYCIQNSEAESLGLLISDLQGSILKQIVLQGKSGQEVISTNDLIPGLYLCKFIVNGSAKQTIKLSVIK